METAVAQSRVQKSISLLTTIVTVIAGISVLGGVYVYYVNNIWHPDVQINQVDFTQGTATVTLSGKQVTIYGNSTIAVGKVGSWGMRFGTESDQATGKTVYNRLELVKNDMVYDVFFKKSA